MKPTVERFLDVSAAHLMLRTMPALEGYEQSSVGVLGMMLIAVKEEYERAAARRVEENRALRALFADAHEAVEDAELRVRLREAAVEAEANGSLVVSDLEAVNARLRALLIELHAAVEELDTPAARRVEAAVWSELVASTERRRLSLGVF